MRHPGLLKLGILGVVLSLSACARSLNVSQYFFNDMPQQARHGVPKSNKILLVSYPVAVPSYQTKDMQYVQQPYQLSQFARHAWIAPPADMLAPLLVQALQGTGPFYAVVAPPYVGLVDVRLDTKLLALYQEFQGERSQVLLKVQADLVDVAQGRLLKSQQFCVRVDALENTPYGGVIATNQAVKKLLQQIAIFVSIHGSHHLSELPKPNYRS